MGNDSGKIIEGFHLKTVFNEEIHISLTDNIKYEFPKKEVIKEKLKTIYEKLKISPSEKKQLEQLDPQIQWKFIVKVEMELNKLAELRKVQDKAQQEALREIKNLQVDPSQSQLKKIFTWLRKCDQEETQSFISNHGIKVLIQTLEISELTARHNHIYTKQLELLKIINYLVHHQSSSDDALDYLVKIPNYFSTILNNFHFIHPELTCYTLSILQQIIWHSSSDGVTILNNLDDYSKQNKYDYKFEPFFKVLLQSRNVTLIESVLNFINQIVYSVPNDDDKFNIVAELQSMKIIRILKKIKLRIQRKEYDISDCSYDFILKLLNKMKYDKKDGKQLMKFSKTLDNIKEFQDEDEGLEDDIQIDKNGKISFEKSISQVVVEEEVEYYEEVTRKRQTKINLQDSKSKVQLLRAATHVLQKEQQEQVQDEHHHQKQLEDSHDEDFDSTEKKVYLNSHETQKFNDIISKILEHIRNFQNFGKMNSTDQTIHSQTIIDQVDFEQKQATLKLEDILETINQHETNILQNPRDVDQLYEKIKKNAINQNKFKQFLSLFQQIFVLSETNDNFWTTLSNFITNINNENNQQSDNDIKELINSKQNIMNLQAEIDTLNQNLKFRDKEIEKYVSEKNDLLQQIKDQKENIKQQINIQEDPSFKQLKQENEKLTQDIKNLQNQIDTLKANQNNNTNIPQVPKIPGIGVPQAPQLPGIGVPQAPQLPGIGVPQAPQLPGIGVPQAPQLPGIGVPQAPKLPGLPAIGVPQAPQLPGVGVPQAPQLPGLPGIGVPQAPKLPGLPGMPQAPQLPGLPQAPQLPGMPQIGLPQAPGLPGLPGLPKPGMPGMPGLPGLPGLPKLGQQIPQAPVGKAKKQPKVQMKGLMWNALKQNEIVGTIWEKIDDEKIEYDKELLEKEFAQKQTAVVTTGSGGQQVKVQKVTLLDADRNKNMELILGKLRMSNASVIQALYELDSNVLTMNIIESLINVMPTDAEVKQCKEFDGEIDQLGVPEQFVLAISQVKGYNWRLKAFQFSKIYRDMVDDVQAKLDSVLKVFKNIRNDKNFIILLEHILGYGNYINGTSMRGGAYGFKLDALIKTAEMKLSSNPKKNLLALILENVENKKKIEIIQANEDLNDYEVASKVPYNQLQTDLGEVKKGVTFVKNALQQQTDLAHDHVKQKFEKLYDEIQKIVSELEDKLKQCDNQFQESCKFLCENPKDGSDKFAQKIYDFWNNCKKIKIEMVKQQELLKKEEEKKQQSESKKQQIDPKKDAKKDTKKDPVIDPKKQSQNNTFGKDISFEDEMMMRRNTKMEKINKNQQLANLISKGLMKNVQEK